MAVDDLLRKNRAWAEFQVARDPEYFKRHTHGQTPRLLWIGCADSRVPAESILACSPGEVFVHRNIANIVSYHDVNVASVVQYAVEHLKIEDIAIVGHYGCGGVAAACSEKLIGGYIGDWLMIANRAKQRVEKQLAEANQARPSDEEFLKQVVDQNVLLQLTHLSASSIIRQQWVKTPNAPRLHGWVYDIHHGLIRVLDTVDGTRQSY